MAKRRIMRATPAAIVALFTLSVPSLLLSGPDPLLKITITNGGLTKPIEIVDNNLLTRFFYGAGPGNYKYPHTPSWSGPSFIVDWPQGVVTGPTNELTAYDVEFLTSRTTDFKTYRVTYVYDPAKQEGWVYLPGDADPRYRENAWLILRGNEGNWFHSWSAWDAAVKQLLAGAR
jgi:hypothetical protein